jgi:DNA-binding IclR family transcriptional regulator
MPDEEKNSEALGPRAMSRVLRLFSLLAQESDGLSLAGISARLKVAKSTLLSSLRALTQDDYLNLEGQTYRLGPRAFRLAAEISSEWSLTRTVRGYMKELAKRTKETVTLSIIDLEGRRFIHIDVIDGQNPIRYVARVGTSSLLYANAAGRVLLAFQSEDYREAYLREVPLVPLTTKTVTDPVLLRAQLEQVRREKCWVNLGESEIGGAAIAAPVFGPTEQIIAALAVSAPVERISANQQWLREQVLQTAAHASGMAPLD